MHTSVVHLRTRRLCRNVLAHHWQQQGLVDILQVMMALPDMLGMSAGALAEQVRTCMSKLQPATIEAAAITAATAAEGEEERASAGSAPSAGSDLSAGSGSGSGGAGRGGDPASGRGTPAATGGCWPGSSCSKAHTALLSSSGALSAARRCLLLAGKAVVPHTRAMLPAPAVRRLNLMRVMTSAQAAVRFS